MKRKKPKFLRTEWHKKIRLGKTIKKKRKWRAAKGRHNKIRLNRKSRAKKPKIGWGSPKAIRNKIKNLDFIRIENLSQLESIKDKAILISSKLGKKKKQEIIKKATEKGLTILNLTKQTPEKNAIK